MIMILQGFNLRDWLQINYRKTIKEPVQDETIYTPTTMNNKWIFTCLQFVVQTATPLGNPVWYYSTNQPGMQCQLCTRIFPHPRGFRSPIFHTYSALKESEGTVYFWFSIVYFCFSIDIVFYTSSSGCSEVAIFVLL